MDNLLLLGVIGFVLLMGFMGYKRGFVKIVLSMTAVLITLILASALTPSVSKVVKEKTPLYDNIYKQMEEYVDDKIDIKVDSASKSVQESAIEGLPLPKGIKNELIENKTTASIDIAGGFSAYIADSLTTIMISAITYLALFAAIYIILRIVIIVADIITKLPGLNGVNKFVGFALGALQGIIMVWVMCLVLTALSGTAFGVQVFELINKNEALGYIYNHNFIVPIVTGVLSI